MNNFRFIHNSNLSFSLRTTKRMESYSKNNDKFDYMCEAKILNAIWLITALGLVATAGLAWELSISKLRQQNMIHHQCMLP